MPSSVEISASIAPPRRAATVSGRLVAAYAAFVLAILGAIVLQPKTGGDAAVLVAPWSGPARAARVVASADGDVLSGTRWPFIIIARPLSRHFVADAYVQGAWLVFDAGLIAGCHPQARTAQ